MGTHPIFESDFDCLTDDFEEVAAIYTEKRNSEYGEQIHFRQMPSERRREKRMGRICWYGHEA